MREELQKQNGVIFSLLETVSRQAAKITHLEKQLHNMTSQSDAEPGYMNVSQPSAGERGDIDIFYKVQRAKTNYRSYLYT